MDKRKLYTATKVVPTVDPHLQARHYRPGDRATQQQPDVRAIFIFKVFDDRRLEGLQSGLRYADGSPVPSLRVIRHLESGG